MANGGQKPADLESHAQARILLVRRVTIRTGWKIVLVAVIDFMGLRIWAPNLVNLHQNLALAGAIACVAIAIAAPLWLAFQLWIDIGRFALAQRTLDRARVYANED